MTKYNLWDRSTVSWVAGHGIQAHERTNWQEAANSFTEDEAIDRCNAANNKAASPRIVMVPEPELKTPMTFKFTGSQLAAVERAYSKATAMWSHDTRGGAIVDICQDWMERVDRDTPG